MEILLVRHAAAVRRGDPAFDHARPLASRGRRRFEREARGLGRLGVALDRVYHSPWVRAVQTAELLASAFGAPREALEGLAREPDESLLRAIRGERVALVGHEPWMGELCSLLVAGDSEGGHRFPFKKGAVAWLTGIPTPAGCELRALHGPKALRLLGS